MRGFFQQTRGNHFTLHSCDRQVLEGLQYKLKRGSTQRQTAYLCGENLCVNPLEHQSWVELAEMEYLSDIIRNKDHRMMLLIRYGGKTCPMVCASCATQYRTAQARGQDAIQTRLGQMLVRLAEAFYERDKPRLQHVVPPRRVQNPDDLMTAPKLVSHAVEWVGDVAIS